MPNEYIDSEFVKLREKVHALEVEVARLQENKKDSDKALELARLAMQRSQDASNEWRQENIDQRSLYPTTGKMEGLLATEASERRAVEARVYQLEKIGNADLGKHSAFDAVWVKFAVVFTMLLTVVGLVYKFVTGK